MRKEIFSRFALEHHVLPSHQLNTTLENNTDLSLNLSLSLTFQLSSRVSTNTAECLKRSSLLSSRCCRSVHSTPCCSRSHSSYHHFRFFFLAVRIRCMGVVMTVPVTFQAKSSSSMRILERVDQFESCLLGFCLLVPAFESVDVLKFKAVYT